MTPLKIYPFDAHGRSLEARVSMTNAGFSVQVYEAGRPATAVKYSVSYETAFDADQTQRVDLVKSLVEVAHEDIRRGYVRLHSRPTAAA